MVKNKAKAKLKAGEPTYVISPGFSSPALVEWLGYQGFDAVFLDCEHGPASEETVENEIRAAELSGLTAIVRVPTNLPAVIGRFLDRGAGGVQVPHINTAEEAREMVDSAKFHPLGHRGFGGGRGSYGIPGGMTEYVKQANEETLIVGMVEEVESLNNLDAILKVPNIDVIFFGPGDLSQSMGYPGQMNHPEVVAAIEDGVRKTLAAGLQAGTVITEQNAKRFMDLGVRYIYSGLAGMMTNGVQGYFKTVRG